MHPALSTSYLLPAIFLNPVLFLHGLNTILSRIIPPILETKTMVQPPPYSTFGPSANHPHLDVHVSDNLCWSYTLVMICAQLMAFGRVQRLREEGREERRLKNARAEAVQALAQIKNLDPPAGHIKSLSPVRASANTPNGKINGSAIPSQGRWLSKERRSVKPHTIRSRITGRPARSAASFQPAYYLRESPLPAKPKSSYHQLVCSNTAIIPHLFFRPQSETGPLISLDYSRAPDPPSIENNESSVSSLVDVDSPHVSSVPSDFESQATKTRTQADRMAHEAEDKAREESTKASQKTKETAAEADKKASEASSKAAGKVKEFNEYAAEKSDELSKDASNKYDKAKKSAARNYREGKEEAKEKSNELSRNRDNPVVVGNAMIIGIGSVALGFVGYQKYAKGELTWEVAGLTAAAVGAFAVGDYYLSQYLFKEKFPKK
ncbi:MAG: hypothetical protein Q9213_007610 [Squamulea squamosa]